MYNTDFGVHVPDNRNTIRILCSITLAVGTPVNMTLVDVYDAWKTYAWILLNVCIEFA